MRRSTWAIIASTGLLGALAVGTAADAGVLAFGPYDKQLGDAPVALAVTPGDRVVVAMQDTSTPVLGWFDTLDWRDDAFQREVDDVTDIRCIAAAGDADGPILLVGGSAVAILNVDDSTSPATFTAEVPLGLSGGTVVDLAWDDARGVAYGANDGEDLLHWIPVTGASGAVDSETGWPLPLAFTPLYLAMVGPETLLVGGDDAGAPAGAIVDLTGDTPSVLPLELAGLAGAIVAASAEDGEGWLLSADGALVRIVDLSDDGDDDDATGDDDDSAGDDDDATGDDDDSAGDDDDSAGDDDDSAGDDDDSAGDDDDSAGDDDDSAGDDDDSAGDDDDSASTARSGPFEEQVFASDAPASPVDLLARDGVLYALGGNTVAVLDPETGDSTDTFSLTGIGAALAGSSTDDGYVYVALEDLGQVAILSHGPFLEITSISDTTVDSSDEIEVTLVAGAPATSGTCALSATVGGTIAGDGTAATLDLDEAELGATTVVTIAADALEEGASRVHLFCGDEGAQGRASFSYYLGDLEAPESFTVVAANGRVTASWMDNDDEAVVSYDLLFSTTAFSDGDVPTESNSDNSVTSPHSVSAPDTIGEETVTVEVDSLVNGTTYYFAVAAVDGEGSRGPYSEIAATTPNVTGGVAALTGDPGCTCAYPASGGGGRAAFALLPLMLLAALRRRRTGVRR